jgi:putative aldouronate transport system substrate-binding protein
MKKLLSLLMVSAIMLILTGTVLADDVPTIVVTIANNVLVTDYDDNEFTKWIEQTAGVNLEFNLLPTTDAAEKLALMVASGDDLGDLLIGVLNPNTIRDYAEAGVLKPINKYFEMYDTNLEAFDEQEDSVDIMKAITAIDGNIYGYPTYIRTEGNITKWR